MSMGASCQWRSALRWEQAWRQRARCMWNGLTGRCAIGSMPSRAKRMRLPNAMPAFDALVRLQLFDHNFHRAHQALRLPFEDGVRRYRPRSPAMVLGLTDHLWSFQELLTSRVPITPS